LLREEPATGGYRVRRSFELGSRLEFIGGSFPVTRGQIGTRPSSQTTLPGTKAQLGRGKSYLGRREHDQLQLPIPQATDYADREVDFHDMMGDNGPPSDVREMISSIQWLPKPRTGTLFDFVSLSTMIDEFDASACCRTAVGLSDVIVSHRAENIYPAIIYRGAVSPAEFGSSPDLVDCACQYQSSAEGGKRFPSSSKASVELDPPVAVSARPSPARPDSSSDCPRHLIAMNAVSRNES
jgi:hypothetical protein